MSSCRHLCLPHLCLPLFLCLLLLANPAQAQTLVFNPTTTLTAETANNTSAPDNFFGQSNGNPPVRNTSKLPIRSLLYSASTTRIYAHFMPWFGQPNHLDIGYSSADSAQVKRQVDDMLSRGIEGVVIDWYGPISFENNPTILVMQEVQLRIGFEFAIMEDVGALKYCVWTPGCNLTDQVISDLSYVYVTFQSSPRYMRLNGRPVVFFFGLEKYPELDWNRIQASVPGNPIFIFRNTVAYDYVASDGAFAWIEPPTLAAMPSPTYMGLDYFDFFYNTAQQYPNMLTYGSVYPGFDDTLASWTMDRHIAQNCGQTWLATFAEIGKFYSPTNQLPALQLVTWNDYEEGTEIETGIDNCLSVSGTMSGSTLTWTLGGQGAESTLDRYTVFLSEDGEQLMQLANVAVGSRSLNLASYGLDPAKTYTLYIKAQAKASLQNHVSAPVIYRPANQPPNAVLSVSPTSGTAPLSVNSSTSNSSDPDGTIVSSRIDFGDGTIATATSAAHTYSNAGTYTLTATVTDNAGASSTASATVTASAATISCTPSTINRTITICAPKHGQTVSRPVRVVAVARDSATVQYMQVFVDGVKVYTRYSTKSSDTYINVSVGTHSLKVSAKDGTGIFSKTITFTAQ